MATLKVKYKSLLGVTSIGIIVVIKINVFLSMVTEHYHIKANFIRN